MTEKFEIEISSNLLASLAGWEGIPEERVVFRALEDFVGKYGYDKSDLNKDDSEVLIVRRRCEK